MTSTPPAPTGSTTTDERPDPAADARPPKRAHGQGNWRSLLLSMIAVGAVVLVLFAVVPRPDAITQPPVDVAPVAQAVAEESGRPVWVPQLDSGWRSSTARRQEDEGVRAFYAGYHRTDDDHTFVAVQEIAADTRADAKKAWVAKAVSNGRADGTVQVGGTTWARYTNGGDPTRRGLVADLDGTTTVLSGLADYDTLTRVAATLQPVRR